MKRCLVLTLICALLFPCAYAAGYTLKLSATNLRLSPGESRTVTWSVEPVNLVTHTVTWSSENSYIASVDQNGRITGRTAGSTYVHATLETGTDRRITVTVTGQPITKLSLSQSRVDLEVGEKAQLQYSINESADDKRVRWSSDEPSVATVDQNGIVTAVSGGIATVTLLAVNGMTATCLIYVPSEVKKVELYPAESYLGIGETLELDAYIYPGNARDRALTWESHDPSVAEVDENGVVRGVSAGETYIRALNVSGAYALCLVKVSLLPRELLAEPDSVVLSKENRTATIRLSAQPAGSENSQITWTSSDPGIVSVDDGILTARNYGQAVVTAQAVNGVSASVSVIVSEPPESVRFSQSSYTLPAGGESIALTPVFSPSGSAAAGLVYSSDHEDIATVDANGMLTPLAYGTCRVTLRCDGGLTCSADVRVYEDIKSLLTAQTNITLTQYELRPISFYSETGKPYLSEPAAASDNEEVCVYVDGCLYAKNPGKARITFSNPGTAVTCQVTVSVTPASSGFARCVALTFDNGPDEYTDEILQVLADYNISATFFLLGQNLQSNADQAALLKDTPHEIGNHTYDNSSIASYSLAEAAEAIDKTDRLARELIGRSPTVLRTTDALLPRSVFTSFFDSRRFIGKGHVMPDADGSLSAEALYEYALSCVYNTSVLSFHDCGSETAGALRLLIPELLRRGYRFLTISELIEYTGSQQDVFSTMP